MIRRAHVRRALAFVLILVAAYFGVDLGDDVRVAAVGDGRTGAAPLQPGTGGGNDRGAAAIAEAFRDRRSDLWIETGGVVEAVLRDDLEGSRHQRFIVELPTSQTVLVSHNIDLAPRVDGLSKGDAVRFRGEYEYNDRGGVVHWTHHDPQGRRKGGWIEHGGRRYE